jgi:hypothetical protein
MLVLLKDGFGGICTGNEKCLQVLQVENLNENDLLGDQGVKDKVPGKKVKM